VKGDRNAYSVSSMANWLKPKSQDGSGVESALRWSWRMRHKRQCDPSGYRLGRTQQRKIELHEDKEGKEKMNQLRVPKSYETRAG